MRGGPVETGNRYAGSGHDGLRDDVLMGELLGYARMSPTEYSVGAQGDALRAAGCSRVWVETASAATTSLPEIANVLAHLRCGDTLVVWRLDILGRSLHHLLRTVEDLGAGGIGFRSLTEEIDTTTSGGEMIYSLMGALVEFERNRIREQSQMGVEAARAQGRVGGRPRQMSDAEVAQAKRMRARGISLTDIRDAVGVSRSTLYRYLK